MEYLVAETGNGLRIPTPTDPIPAPFLPYLHKRDVEARDGDEDHIIILIEMQVCVVVFAHDDCLYLDGTLRLVGDLPKLVVISKVSWTGAPGNWQETQRIAEEAGAAVLLGEWLSEDSHRQAAYTYALEQGFTHAIIPDSDELIEPRLLDHLLGIAAQELADRVYVEWDTYWKSPEYVIRPRERFTPCILIDLRVARQSHLRNFEGGRMLYLNETYGIIHHLSYSGPDSRIWKKITTWGHKDEVQTGWWERVWKAWDSNKLMRNLHPTHPNAYGFAERVPVPELVTLAGITFEPVPTLEVHLGRIPKVSVVIPACGGHEDLEKCLASLRAAEDLLHEIIVVDNASSPPIEAEEGIIVFRNEKNLGFALASNQGAEAATGDTILFLNSDTQVPRVALLRLLASLQASGSIAAAGPYTNNCGHFQKIDPTYTDEAHLNLFAEDFAARMAEDIDTDMLVGFCLAVKRSALDEVGLFDERFGLGTFEDNDLCYRLRRAGYRLVISACSYIQHAGSKTMRRLQSEDPERTLSFERMLKENRARYVAKWRKDLETGFANALSGLAGTRILFQADRKPEFRIDSLKSIIKLADISLCMVVENQEEALRNCLESVKPFVREIVVIDTGSTDSTCEVAEEFGAIVRTLDWPDSFAVARNASIEDTAGRWILWLDAEEMFPLDTAEEIVRTVSSAPEDAIGFVVAVQYSDGQGSRVDHLKIFRNLPGLRWEGRIYEQVLPQLLKAAVQAGIKDGGRILTLKSPIVHSDENTPEETQARRRTRDDALLRLNLEDHPDDPQALFHLGLAEFFVGSLEKAVGWFEQCVRHATGNEPFLTKAYAMLGSALNTLGRREEGTEWLEVGLAKGTDNTEILLQLAQITFEAGDVDAAIGLYRRVLDSADDNPLTVIQEGEAKHHLASAYAAREDFEQAKLLWRSALEDAPELEYAIQLFDAALKTDDLVTARDILRWIHERAGGSEEWASLVLSLAAKVGLDAVPQLEMFLQAQPENIGVRRALAHCFLKAGNKQRAADHFFALQERNVAEGAYQLGLIFQEAGDAPKAEAWFEKTRQLDPGFLGVGY